MRLTKKKIISNQNTAYEIIPNFECERGTCITTELIAIDKLGQLEDIEEELGIDLITLFKAMKNGITYRTPLGDNYAYTILTNDRLSIEYKWKCLRKGTQKFYFKDYGKTWALTKEELE